MDYSVAALVCVVSMLFLMLMGMRIVYALGFTALVVAFFTYGPFSLEKLGWTTFNTLFNINWVPLPLFVLIACLIAETKMGEDIYGAARSWLSRVPGGLRHGFRHRHQFRLYPGRRQGGGAGVREIRL